MATMVETSEAYASDILGAPYTAELLEMPDDEEGPVTATLVRRQSQRPTRCAVLHVHGFSDYFFQTGYADHLASLGYDFYALDLRKCGRSLLPHQTHNFCRSLDEYYPEIDAAVRRIRERDGHSSLVLSGHSTGGLLVALWCADRPDMEIEAVVLNSPWLDLQGAFWLRTRAASFVLDQVGRRKPYRIIPRGVSGLYVESLHRTYKGEWDFDLAWKPKESIPVRAGWLRAIRAAQRRIHGGTHLPAPILVMTSARSSNPEAWSDEVTTTDIVLDVSQMSRWAPGLADDVALVRIDGALHDVFLSREPVRDKAYDQLTRWLRSLGRRTGVSSEDHQTNDGDHTDNGDEPAIHDGRQPPSDRGTELAPDHRADGDDAGRLPRDV
jgi:alpha-beta hydrolase superfamily lysophospholipase